MYSNGIYRMSNDIETADRQERPDHIIERVRAERRRYRNRKGRLVETTRLAPARGSRSNSSQRASTYESRLHPEAR